MTLRQLAIKSLASILVGAGLFASFSAMAQSRGQLALPDLGASIRKTCPTCAQPDNPFWHAANDQEGVAPTGFAFNQNSAITTIDLRNYCSQPDGYGGAGTRVITLVAGSLPTGISLGTSQLTGTPTVVESTSAAFRCTLDGAGTDDQSFTFDVTGTDTTPPPVPSNFECGPTNGTSQTAITCTWSAVTDPSGILEYRTRYATTEVQCNSALTSDNTLLLNSAATTAQLTGLSASTTIWFKVLARDNSPAQNLSAFTACVSGTTASGGGGGAADIWSDNFEVGSGPDTSLWSLSINLAGTGSCTQVTSSTGGADSGTKFMRFTLVANPTAGDAGGGAYRCELGAKAFTHEVPDGLVQEGDTAYYGMSYRMPAATLFDPEKGDTVTQIFQDIGGGTGCHESIKFENNTLKWATQDCTRPQQSDTLLSPVIKDTWYRVCQVYKWSKTGTGFHKIWINATAESNTPVLNYSGATLIAAPQYVGKVKIGNYKTGWRTTNTAANQEAMSPRILDIDDVRVATTFAGACL